MFLLQGPPNAAYDKPVFLHSLDLSSTNKFPRWTDGLIVRQIT